MYKHRRKTLLNNGHLKLVFISGSARCMIISQYVSKDLGRSFLFKFELDPVRNRHCTRTSQQIPSDTWLSCRLVNGHAKITFCWTLSFSLCWLLPVFVLYFKITTINSTSLIFLVIFLWASELLIFKNRKDFVVKPKCHQSCSVTLAAWLVSVNMWYSR